MDTRTAEPTTVEEILWKEFMLPNALSHDVLPANLGITPARLIGILSHACPLSDEEAELLGEYFGTGGVFWRNLRDSHLRWQERMAHAV